MQQPRMIVLGLIAQGVQYGFEMERYIETSKMRQWARIGKSTIYKALKDLLRGGELTERQETAERGPGKAVFSLTPDGKKSLHQLVREALGSDESVYSDRIAGLVFASTLPPKVASQEIEQSIQNMKNAVETIKTERKSKADNAVANIVLGFYQKVYTAEREAMAEMKTHLAKQ